MGNNNARYILMTNIKGIFLIRDMTGSFVLVHFLAALIIREGPLCNGENLCFVFRSKQV